MVLLVAPYGAGKSVLAGQLADELPGARARVTSLGAPEELERRIADAWGLPLAAGAGGLAPLCASLDGPGTIVVDELESPAAGAQLPEVIGALPDGVRLVVCTRDETALTAVDVVKLGADGRLVVLRLDELRFDTDELREFGAADDSGHGGWPVAEAAATGARPPDGAALCRAAMDAAPERVRAVVALLAPCGAVAEPVVRAVAGPESVDELAGWTWRLSPAIARLDGAVVHFSPAAAATASSSPVPVDVGAVDRAADSLGSVGEAIAAVEALIVLQRWEAVAALLAKHARTLLADGHGNKLACWVRRIPEAHHTLTLAFAAAYAGLNSGETGIADLEALHDRIWAEEPELGPWAAATLLWAMLGLGDPRFLKFCSNSLTRVLGGFPLPRDLERRLADLPRPARGDALHLVMAAVQLLLLSRHPDAREQARALVAAVEQSLLRLGRSVEAARALFVVGEIFTGARVPGDPALSVLPSIDSAPRSTGMWCLLRLMFAAVRFGDVALLEALAERLEAWLEQVPDLCAGDVLPPAMSLAAMRYFVASLSGGAAGSVVPATEDDVEAMWHAHLAHHTNSARVSAILISVCRLEAGDVSGARFWYGRASERRDNRFLLLEELEVLHHRLSLRETASEAALAALDRQVEANRAQGHRGSVTMLQRWLVLDLAAIGRTDDALERLTTAVAAGEVPAEWEAALGSRIVAPVPDEGPPAGIPTLRFLDAEVSFEDATGRERAVRGLQARLLTVLATRDGRVEVDRAVDLLFGDTDADSGRQRLYTTVYRTRKQLGLGAPALRVEDGVVRLDDRSVRVDVWGFERGVGSPDASAARAALDLYRDDLCSRQFAYEDFAEEPRRMLRSRYVRAVLQFLDGVLASGTIDAPTVDLARKAWRVCPEDEELCARVATILAHSGHRGEALEVVRATSGRLDALGLTSDLADLVADDLDPASGRGHPIHMGSRRPERDSAG